MENLSLQNPPTQKTGIKVIYARRGISLIVYSGKKLGFWKRLKYLFSSEIDKSFFEEKDIIMGVTHSYDANEDNMIFLVDLLKQNK